MAGNKGNGRGIQLIRSLVGHIGDACLIWPYCRDLRGYGTLGYNGKVLRASRVMCELVYGAPPTQKHHAAHNCGKGHEGCFHPGHLEWKSGRANQLDRRKHGTHTNGPGKRGAVTAAQVIEIRAAKGIVTQRELAAKYGISDATVRGIQTRRWWKHVA